MSNAESILDKPFEFDSPIEFVLIGVEGKKRAVVAKSRGAQMDLVAYAQRESDDEDERPYVSPLFPFPFPFPSNFQLYPIAIDSPPTDFRSNHESDDRASECTLVWRGSGYSRDKAAIKKEFRTRVEEIVSSLEQRSAPRLEWALSPIIDRCHRATAHSKARRLRFVYAFWFTLLVYAIGVGVWVTSSLLL